MTMPDGWLADCADDLKESLRFLTRLPLGRAAPDTAPTWRARPGRSRWPVSSSA